MDISELRRERDAYRKRQQEAELAKLETQVTVLEAEAQQLEQEFLELAEACYAMTLLMVALSQNSPKARLMAWVFAVLTKGSLMMINEEAMKHDV